MAMTINSLPDAAPRVKGPARRRYGADVQTRDPARVRRARPDGKGELLRREVLLHLAAVRVAQAARPRSDRGARRQTGPSTTRPDRAGEHAACDIVSNDSRATWSRARTVIESSGKVSALLEEFVTDSAEINGVETR